MNKTLKCDCGFEARAAHEDELVHQVRRHAQEAHGMTLSHDEVLLLAFRAELDANTAGTISRETTAPTTEEET